MCELVLPENSIDQESGPNSPFSDDISKGKLDNYCKRYMSFLSASKTVRTTVANAIELAKLHGFIEYTVNMPLQLGDRVFFNNRDLSVCFAVIGEAPLQNGMNLVAAHVDSPRLDVRARPLIEQNNLAFLKTHYYGWLRKYQWMSIPLMLQGVVVLRDGSKVNVSIGDSDDDPTFVINDLLPHISAEQNRLQLDSAHTGEMMNVLVASAPVRQESPSDSLKKHVLSLLQNKFGMREDDFVSSDLEFVPALPVRHVGFDNSMIGGFGHDDKVCAFAALDGLLATVRPRRTAVVIWADREEVGNNGISGIKSRSFDYFLAHLCKSQQTVIEESYRRSFCLSADVTAAFDPNFADYYTKENSAHLNHGIAICKYTGFRGKEQASEASAELLAFMRHLLDKNEVPWQTAEMGRIDLGGGGTVALELANRGIDTLDAGVPVLGMHSPFETVAKIDCYATRQACEALFATETTPYENR